MHHESTAGRDVAAARHADFLRSLQMEQAAPPPAPYRTSEGPRPWLHFRYGLPVTAEQAASHAAVIERETTEVERGHGAWNVRPLRAVS